MCGTKFEKRVGDGVITTFFFGGESWWYRLARRADPRTIKMQVEVEEQSRNGRQGRRHEYFACAVGGAKGKGHEGVCVW